MSDLATTIHNERTKLTATWINGLAIAIFAIGGLAPIFSVVYSGGVITITTGTGTIVCLLLSGALDY